MEGFLGFFSLLPAIGICADSSTAETLFPYSFWLNQDYLHWSLFPILLALIQYPLYGLIIGFTYMKDRAGKPKLLWLIVVVLVVHCIAVSIVK